MIFFFKTQANNIIATEVDHQLSVQEIDKLRWLYGDAGLLSHNGKAQETVEGFFVGQIGRAHV